MDMQRHGMSDEDCSFDDLMQQQKKAAGSGNNINDDNSIAKTPVLESMRRMLSDQMKFTEMCKSLLDSIPDDLKKDNERNLMIMMSECIDASNHIQIPGRQV